LASNKGTLISVGLNVKTAVGNIRTAIYSIANALLGESSSVAAATGWNDLAISGVTIVKGTEYCLAFQASSNSLSVYKRAASPTGFRAIKAQAYGAFPASLAAGTLQTDLMNMRMIYA